MSPSDPSDPCDPRTREYLQAVVRSLSQEATPVIKIVKRAQQGIGMRRGLLGVLPASFNPPTAAHEALIREAGKAVVFDEILLVLDQQAMDKELVGAPLEDRLLMLLVLFGDDSQISLGISNRGLFLEKVQALQEVYPPGIRIYFIVGYDTIERVLDPKYYHHRDQALHELFSQTRFLVANRGNRDERTLRELFRHEENRSFASQVSPLTLPPALAGISSSEVRRRLTAGKPIHGLVPPTLEEFLLKRGFYGRQGS
jgi:nicotinic acid mononucleotide adenylyltransferase